MKNTQARQPEPASPNIFVAADHAGIFPFAHLFFAPPK